MDRAFRAHNFTRAAEQLSETIVHAIMLGALDSGFERENEQAIAPVAFAMPSLPGLAPVPEPSPGFANKGFAAAFEWFDSKQILDRASFDQLSGTAKRKAFTVAGLAKKDVLETVHAEIGKQIVEGADFRTFRKAITDRLDSAGWTPSNPSHVECLPGDTTVTGAMVRAAHRRWYEGDLVEVVTASGRKFSTTPNHPMLTRRGWVSTGALQEGDDLIGYRRQEHAVPVRDHDVAAPPSSIAEIFAACSQVGNAERIEGHRDDFHGDGRDGDVDVARPARELSFGVFAPITKPLEHHVFAPSALATPRFCRLCGHLMIVSQRCGFCDATESNPGLPKHPLDRVAARREVVRENVGAHAAAVAGNDLLTGEIATDARRLSASAEEEIARLAERASLAGSLDHGSGPALSSRHRSGDLIDCQAGDVEFERVVSVSVRVFRGHVFNLSTAHGYFTIDGLFTGNTIFRTNVMGAYNVGRFAEMRQPAVLKLRPYWQVLGVNDARTRKSHKRIHAWVFRADDPGWHRCSPPLGYCCRCRVRSLSQVQVDRLGLKVHSWDEISDLPDEGFDSGVDAFIEFVPPPAAPPAAKPHEPMRPRPGAGAHVPHPLAKPIHPEPPPAPYPHPSLEPAPAPPEPTPAPPHPEPPPSVATEGVHFKTFASNASEKDQKLVLDTFAEHGMLPFLERAPLEHLEVKRTLKRRRDAGLYYGHAKRMEIRTGKIPNVVLEEFKPGVSFTMGNGSKTWEGAVQRNTMHELGHHVHLSGDVSVKQAVTNEYRLRQTPEYLKKYKAITRYAQTSQAEWFAESFAAYRYERTALLELDPVAHDTVREVLRLQGISDAPLP